MQSPQPSQGPTILGGGGSGLLRGHLPHSTNETKAPPAGGIILIRIKEAGGL